MASKRVVMVVANPTHGIVKAHPAMAGVEFVTGGAADLKGRPELKEAECLVTFCTDKSWAEQLIDLWPDMPNVKWVHSLSAGVDAMAPFIKQCLTDGRGKDVVLTNGRGAFSSSLAEWVMMAVLHYNKQIPRCLSNRVAKRWDNFCMDTVDTKTIGFVGFGSIAQASAKLAKAFDMTILAMRNRPEAEDGKHLADEVYGADQKDEMFPKCDFVVSTLPATPTTLNFFDEHAFNAMKPGAVFISIGRGAVVDEDALFTALTSKHLAGASLDVFKTEPLPESSKLWDCETLLVSAHNADLTHDYGQLGWGIWEKNMQAHTNNTAFHSVVDKSAGY